MADSLRDIQTQFGNAGTVPQKSGWVVTKVLTGVKTVLLRHVSVPVRTSCVTIVRRRRRRKRETNMTLNQLQVLPKPLFLTKLLNNCFAHTALEGVTKRTFLNIFDLELAWCGLKCRGSK